MTLCYANAVDHRQESQILHKEGRDLALNVFNYPKLKTEAAWYV